MWGNSGESAARPTRHTPLLQNVLFQNFSKGTARAGAAVLNNGVAALDLAEGSAQHFVRHGAGKENHQIGISQLVFQNADRLCKDLGLAAVFPADILIPALHTFVSAKNDNAQCFLLSIVFCRRLSGHPCRAAGSFLPHGLCGWFLL